MKKKNTIRNIIHEYVGFLPKLKLRLDALLKYTMCIKKMAVIFERFHVTYIIEIFLENKSKK
jgi:hypothetical protein